MEFRPKYVALSGGVGGAKLALGLSHILRPKDLLIVANIADDFEHLGLHISPDLDSVMYALAGIDDPIRGWGLAGESWRFLKAIGRLGGDTWFQLGDQDMATHVTRSLALKSGKTLSDVTMDMCRALGIKHRLLPMSNDPVRTMVHCEAGLLEFQRYFVEQQCKPKVSAFDLEGIDTVAPQSDFLASLSDPDLAGIIICPSNPYVSIDPIIRMPQVADALKNSKAPVIAVSPIVGGKALKGPAAKMMTELGLPCNARTVAEYYRDFIDLFVLDRQDDAYISDIEALGIDAVVTDTVMKSMDNKIALARTIISQLEGASK